MRQALRNTFAVAGDVRMRDLYGQGGKGLCQS